MKITKMNNPKKITDIYREAPFADPLKNDLYNKYLIST